MSVRSATWCRSCMCTSSGASAPIPLGPAPWGPAARDSPIPIPPPPRSSSARRACLPPPEPGSPMPASTDGLGFITNMLARHSAERDQGALERALGDPDALTVLIAGDVPILRAAGEGATGFLPLSDLERLTAHDEQIFLGTREGRPVLGTLAPGDAAEAFKDDPAFRVVDLRSVAVQGLVPAEELG